MRLYQQVGPPNWEDRDTSKPPQHISDICCGGFGILGLLDLMTFVSTNK